jgi:hypothetical protein
MKLVFLIALLLASPAPAAQERTYLASVDGISLGPREYVDEFSIETWGVQVVATCQIPPGWTITAGYSADPTGTIAGEASLGVTFLNRSGLRYLNSLVLLRTDEPVRRHPVRQGIGGVLPATFVGTARIGKYGLTDQTRKQKLDYRNVHLVPASRCPVPRR